MIMKQFVFSLLIISGFILSSCQSGWTDEQRSQFINDCTNASKKNLDEETALNYCKCVAEKIEKEYPKFSDVDPKSDFSKKTMEECLAKFNED